MSAPACWQCIMFSPIIDREKLSGLGPPFFERRQSAGEVLSGFDPPFDITRTGNQPKRYQVASARLDHYTRNQPLWNQSGFGLPCKGQLAEILLFLIYSNPPPRLCLFFSQRNENYSSSKPSSIVDPKWIYWSTSDFAKIDPDSNQIAALFYLTR